MKLLNNIFQWLRRLSTWIWWDYDDEPACDEYEDYDKETNMED